MIDIIVSNEYAEFVLIVTICVTVAITYEIITTVLIHALSGA